jgi:dienelactone hydrolase
MERHAQHAQQAGGAEPGPEVSRARTFVVELDQCGPSLAGDLAVPTGARGVVLFAHGSGSSRRSPRNRQVAQRLGRAGLATLLLDLLTPDEEEAERQTGGLRFDIDLLTDRLTIALGRLQADEQTRGLPVGCFGASTGAAAALGLAGREPDAITAVVSRGGRPDLTPPGVLQAVRAPVLLIVGGDDRRVIAMNREAQRALPHGAMLEIVPGATHLFAEPGTLERVADLAAGWFTRHLGRG